MELANLLLKILILKHTYTMYLLVDVGVKCVCRCEVKDRTMRKRRVLRKTFVNKKEKAKRKWRYYVKRSL